MSEKKDIRQTVKDRLNDLFKDAISYKSWKNIEEELMDIYNRHQHHYISVSQNIVLKLMMISHTAQKASEELINLFGQTYQALMSQVSHGHEDYLFPLFQQHLEAAFKLTIHKNKNIQIRAYVWLASICEAIPQGFLSEIRSRTVKTLYTHCINVVDNDEANFRNESMRICGVKVLAFLSRAAYIKQKENYYENILSYLLKFMLDDDKEKIRYESLLRIDINDSTIPFILKKTSDISTRIRAATYMRLKKSHVKLACFNPSDSITLVLNGLKDVEPEVVQNAKDYLAAALSSHKDKSMNWKNIILSNLRIAQLYQEPKVIDYLYIICKDVILVSYSLQLLEENMKFFVEVQINQPIDGNSLIYLFENFIFYNVFLQVFRERQHEDQFFFDSLEYLVHYPSIDQIIKIIRQAIDIDREIQQSQEHLPFQQLIYSLINQCIETMLFIHTSVLKDEAEIQKIYSSLREFITNISYFKNQTVLVGSEHQLEKFADDLQSQGKSFFIETKLQLLGVVVEKIKQLFQLEPEKFCEFMEIAYTDIDNVKGYEDKGERILQLKEGIDAKQKDLEKIASDVKDSGSEMEFSQKEQSQSLTQRIEKAQKKLKRYEGKLTAKQTHQYLIMKNYIKNLKLKQEDNQVEKLLSLLSINDAKIQDESLLSLTQLEYIGQLMIINKQVFVDNIKRVIDILQQEESKQTKSELFFSALKIIFDCLIIHGFLMESKDDRDLERQELRSILVKLLKDCDLRARILAIEGFCRLLICERLLNPWDFIARLILIMFEKTQKFECQDWQSHCIRKLIKKQIEDFLSNYVRLSFDRCIEVFGSTIIAIYYLLKSKAANQIYPHWDVNVFYLFGTMADYLKFKNNKLFGVFDLSAFGISFQLQFFKFFAYLLTSTDKLNETEKTYFVDFTLNCLRFLDFEEIPFLIDSIEDEYVLNINPIFVRLYSFFSNLEGQQKINEYWRKLAEIYIRKTPSIDSKGNYMKAAKDLIDQEKRQIQKIDAEFYDDDQEQIYNHCVGFYSNMSKNAKEIKEQKITSTERQPAPIIKGKVNSEKDAQKAFKYLSKKLPNINQMIKKVVPTQYYINAQRNEKQAQKQMSSRNSSSQIDASQRSDKDKKRRQKERQKDLQSQQQQKSRDSDPSNQSRVMTRKQSVVEEEREEMIKKRKNAESQALREDVMMEAEEID